MSPRPDAEPSLFGFMLLRYLVIDLFVGVILMVLWLLTYDTRQPGAALVMCVSLFVVRLLGWVAVLRRELAPFEAWRRATRESGAADTPVDDQAVRKLEAALSRLPAKLSVVFVSGWGLYFAALPLLAWTVFPELVALGRAELASAALQVGAVMLGAHATYGQLTSTMIDAPLAELDAAIVQRDTPNSRSRSPLQPRLIRVGVTLALAPLLWFGSMSWLGDVQSSRELAVAELRAGAERAARAHASGQPIDPAFELVDTMAVATSEDIVSGVLVREERAWVAIALDDGRWLHASAVVEFPTTHFAVMLSLMCFATIVWSAMTSFAQARAIMLPVLRLRDATRRMITRGDLRAMGRVPIICNDEVGDLTDDFNRMLDGHEQLARAAEAVADGRLAVELEGQGDLPDAFRRMLDRLHALVLQLRVTSLSLGSATQDILEAVGNQDAATERQIGEFSQVNDHMLSLASSAAEVEVASENVRTIAQRTFVNTDDLADKIRMLATHNQAVEGMLEQVRGIAARSDLLALNGSLEATRAGEAGRGFALVAAEMRSLAERITGIVRQMHTVVATIQASSEESVQATELGRTLARETANAANVIAKATREQSIDTDHASTAMVEVATILAESSAVTNQTRSIAEALGVQAAQLEHTLESFELREFDVS